MDSPEQLQQNLLAEVEAADGLDALEAVRVAALGRKGEITKRMKGLGSLEADERRAAGQALNRVKEAVQTAIEDRKADLEDSELDSRLANEAIDVSLSVEPQAQGRLHPISQTLDEVIAIFGEMGFSVAEGPDIEDDFHNFTAL
ncbi:MAG: phenylalanine--tRNA ligase subunit alpha, partial [Rhodospirillales bacterium]|nr:phenylalanine--tRNA ligase subunit alpha [Rhodospirillales bacterium]